MTTHRTRRTKSEQAIDILTDLAKQQQAMVAQRKTNLEQAQAELAKTCKALEALNQIPLPVMEGVEVAPGLTIFPAPRMEPEPPVKPGPTLTDVGATEAKAVSLLLIDHPNPSEMRFQVLKDVVVTETEAAPASPPPSAPRHQRIGKKAPAISDVWDPKGRPQTVHTALMYSRQESCSLCREGIPFVTEKRTEHYVIFRDEAGVKVGGEYMTCTGVKEPA